MTLGVIFSPAVAIMHRLKYGQKFLFISILFALPLALTTFSFLRESNAQIAFTQKELYGTAYLRPLEKMLKGALALKALQSPRVSEGVPELQRTEVLTAMNQAIREADAVDLSYGAAFGTTHRLQSLKHKWKLIRLAPTNELLNEWISELGDLIAHVGDASNLILDPDLDTYYLMDVILLRLPENQRSLGMIAEIGERAILRQALLTDELGELMRLKTVVEYNFKKTLMDFKLAFANTSFRELKAGLIPHIEKRDQASRDVIRTVEDEFVWNKGPTISSQELHAFVEKALGESFSLWSQTTDQLDILLQKRLDRLARRQNKVLTFCGLALLLVMFFWVGFHRSVMQTIAHLEKSSQKMLDGAPAETILLETHDELGRVANSFNLIIGRLFESESKYRGILDVAAEAVVSVDEDQRVIFFNQAATEIFQYSKEEILGKPLDLLIPMKFRTAHHGHIESFGGDKDSSRRMGNRSEVIGLRKNGEEFPAEASISKIATQDGKKIFTATLRDVSEKKRAEAALKKTQDSLQRITDAVPGVVYQYLLTPDGTQKFLMVSQGITALIGCSPKELLNDFNLLWGCILDEDKKRIEQSIRESYRTLEPWSGEFRIMEKSGRIKWIRGQSVPEPVQADGSLVWNGVLIDITETKKIEAQLLQSQKMETLGILAGGIAHDLNNQMTPLVGYLDLILQDTSLSGQIRPMLTEANDASKRCAEIVQGLLNFSRTRLSAEKKTFELGGSVRSFEGLVRRVLPSTIQLKIDVPPDLWPVTGNETELQGVFMNLAVNAKDAMPRGGCLTVGAGNVDLEKTQKHPGGHYVRLVFTDTGTGISKDMLKKIFEPFFTTKEIGEGTGLGLAMVSRIIEEHQGWVEVYSEVGKGASFSIYLPATIDAKLPVVTQGSVDLKKVMSKKGETILLADDEGAVRGVGKTFLERLGYKAMLAQDSLEALLFYEKNLPVIGAVVLDMTMPTLSGVETIRRLLKINPSVKIIVASGFTAEATTLELLELGAVAAIQKPYTIHDLGLALKKVFI